jgi:hypothetical protein
MKTLENPAAANISDKRKCGKINFLVIMAISFFTLIGFSNSTKAQGPEINANIDLPSWAPYYENANVVRYYYFPDIECYYDVMNREFIYLEDGQWMFGNSLPPVYAWFDLNNCFIVALNARVFEPWRHFHYYVAHYPRYYYRSYYHDIYMDRSRPLRGFNENERSVVYNRPSETRNNSYNGRNGSRQNGYNTNENRQRNEGRQGYSERRVSPIHPSEPMKYYGKSVGRPVKVQKHMKEARMSGNRHGHQHKGR